MVEVSVDRPVVVKVQNVSAVLGKLLAEKQRTDEDVFAVIREHAVQADAARSAVSHFFELGSTSDDNKAIQLRSFVEAQKEVCQILNIHHKPHSNRGSKTVWEKEIVKAVSRGVVFKCIYPVNCTLPPILAELCRKSLGCFQVRRLDTDFARCDIIDNKKVLIKLVHQDATQYGGVIFVENERFAANLLQVFQNLWDAASVEP